MFFDGRNCRCFWPHPLNRSLSCGLTFWKLTINHGECLVDTHSASGITKSQKGKKWVSNNITKKKKKKCRHRILVKKVTACINDRSQFATGTIARRHRSSSWPLWTCSTTTGDGVQLAPTAVDNRNVFFSRCLNGRTRRLRDSSAVRIMSWTVIACCIM